MMALAWASTSGSRDAADSIELIEAGDRDAQARETLTQLQADHAQADDGQRGRQGLQLEQTVAGDETVAEGLPGLGHQGPGAGGDNDGPGADALAADLDQGGFQQAGIVLDKDLGGHAVGAVGQDAINQGVTDVANVFEGFRGVQS
jgi:hypothetical protein